MKPMYMLLYMYLREGRASHPTSSLCPPILKHESQSESFDLSISFRNKSPQELLKSLLQNSTKNCLETLQIVGQPIKDNF